VNVFIAMQTQWRVGFGGPTGLDYNVLPSVMRMQRIPRKQWLDVFECLRVMEGEALQVMRENSD
jgi:hypothetical protein